MSAKTYTPHRSRRLPGTADALDAMPIYVNGYRNPLPGIAGRHVMFFGSTQRMTAYDLESEQEIWSVEIDGYRADQAPVADLDRGILYFTGSLYPKNGNGFQEWVYSVSLDGTGLEGFRLDLDGLLADRRAPDNTKPSEFVHCRTALGLNSRADPPYLFFGCGVIAGQDSPRYRRARGSRGLLIAVELDGGGRFKGPDAVSRFSPSRLTENPETGFDTGIWNSGAGPAVLPDGSLLLATGNGPLIPDEGNYGCSVLRLDGHSLEPISGAQGSGYYSVDNAPYTECHGINLDLSCSSVASLLHGDKVYSAIAGKDGRLKSFDPFALPGSDPSLKIEAEAGGIACGQPTIQLRNEHVEVLMLAPRNGRSVRRNTDLTLATAGAGKQLEQEGYERGACVGWVRQEPGPGTLELALYNSGPFRHDRVAMAAETEFQKQATLGSFRTDDWRESVMANSTGRIPPYYRAERLGFVYDNDFQRLPAGLRYQRLTWYVSDYGGYYATTEPAHEVLRKRPGGNGKLVTGKDHISQEPIFVAAASAGEGGHCGQTERAGFEKLFSYDWEGDSPTTGWIASSFRVARDHSLSPHWTYERDDDTSFVNSSPVATTAPAGESGLFIFPVVGPDSSQMVILNSADGSLVDQIQFEGQPHFTMPVIVGDRIYLATTGGGIQVFEPNIWTLDSYRQHSWLLGMLGGGPADAFNRQ